MVLEGDLPSLVWARGPLSSVSGSCWQMREGRSVRLTGWCSLHSYEVCVPDRWRKRWVENQSCLFAAQSTLPLSVMVMKVGQVGPKRQDCGCTWLYIGWLGAPLEIRGSVERLIPLLTDWFWTICGQRIIFCSKFIPFRSCKMSQIAAQLFVFDWWLIHFLSNKL